MRIVCLAKLVPDVESFAYDYERNVLIRDNVHQVINPEDASALALALDLKKTFPDTTVETVSMAPRSALPHLQDLVRRGVDRAMLVSDSRYAGSDTYVTSRILARCLGRLTFDWVLSGTHSLDGGTAHVPSQIAEALGVAQVSNITDVERDGLASGSTIVDVDSDDTVLRFAVDGPAVLSLQYSTRIKLPYIPYEKLDQDVSDRIQVVDNDLLGFDEDEVGLAGSLTKVVAASVRRFERKDTRYVRCDDEGVETVYAFLRHEGLLP